LKYYLLICFSLFSLLAFPQGKVKLIRDIHYTAEVGTLVSTNGTTPFWLRANQYGIVPTHAPIVSFRGSVSSDYKRATSKEGNFMLPKFDWGYGLNIVGNVGKANELLVPEAYLKAKLGIFELYAGRRKEVVGLADTTLSSGSYIWSGNALPIPKIQISIPAYKPIGFTKGIVSFKGNYAHGWFENSRSDVKNFYLHQKSLYGRIGKPEWKVKLYAGFNHQVQWGGELLYADPTNALAKNGKLPSSFSDYVGVVTGKSLAVETDTSKFGFNDAGNRGGNHLGTVDIGFSLSLRDLEVLVYRQNIYEDGSLFFLGSIGDGLNGISITNKKSGSQSIAIKKIVFEYLDTRSQGGNFGGDNTNSKLRGMDDYFNHGQYIDGWTYRKYAIGSAFMTTRNEANNPLSLRNSLFSNNRLQAYYLGIAGTVNDNIELNLRLSYSLNNGTYEAPFKTTLGQFSTLITANIPMEYLGGCNLISSISFDQGSLLNNTLGAYIGVKKEW
jgi:hypothetical protein